VKSLAKSLVKSSLLVTALLLAACDPTAHWSVQEPDLNRVVLSVSALAPNDAYAVGGALSSGGDGLFLHYDGTTWHPIPVATQATLWWVFARVPNDVYLVGELGTIFHWDGQALSPMVSGTDRTLYGVWGASADDLWAVGGKPGTDGVILHKDPTGWTVQPTPVPFVAFFKVWGTSSSDVFVCGEGGTILHFDGHTWTSQPTGEPASTTLFTVAGRSPTDVYAVGGFGHPVALHYDGTTWSPLSDPALAQASSLAGVSVDPDGSVILVGASGTRLRGHPGSLLDETDFAPRDDLHATAFTHHEIFAVGGNYVSPPGSPRHGVIAHFGK
jgi:photosystem II stability/assembly factor-like uncharacterized protein